MTFSRADFESRIRKVLNYCGAQDVVLAVSSGLRRRKLYKAEWLVAHACMKPAEYIAFGNGGDKWKSLAGRQDGADVAQRYIVNARNEVAQQCAAIGYEACEWGRINA